MKQKIVFCLLVIASFFQNSALQAQGWRRIYANSPSSNELQYCHDAIKSQNNGFILSVSGYERLAKILKTDSDGHVIQTISYTIDSFEAFGGTILELKDSSIIHVTKKNIKKFNNRNNIVWNNSFQSAPSYIYSTPYNPPALLDEDKLVVFQNDNDTSSVLTLININTGLTLFSKKIAIKQKSVGLFKDKETRGYICITVNNQLDVTIFHTDSTGNTTRTSRVGYKPGLNFRSIKQVEKDNFIFITEESIFKTNAYGDTIWSKNVYSQSVNQLPNRVLANSDAILLKDSNSYVFLHDVTDRVLNRTNMIKLTKYDLNGSEIWSKFITRGSWESANYGTKVLQAPNNGFIIALTGTYIWNDTFIRSAQLIKTDSLGVVFNNYLRGKIYIDTILNCRLDTNEQGFPNRLVVATKNNEPYWAITDSTGNYEIQLDTGNYIVHGILPNANWHFCTPSVSKQFVTFGTTDTANFSAQAVTNCPQMRISTSLTGLRRCFDNNFYSIRYTNEGTQAAQNAYITLKLDSLLEYISATRPLSSRQGQTLRFDLGTVPIGFEGQFSIQVRVKCGDSTRLGQSLCTEARIFPDTICVPAPNWSGANIVVNGRCDRDSVRFLIQNIGTATSAPLRRKIVEDEIVFLNGLISVPANGSQTISVPANGKTWQLLMEQEPNNPLSNRPTAVVEGCRLNQNQPISTGFVNQFPTDDGSPTIDNVCTQIVGSFDPNDKEGLPLGYKSAHFIDQNQDIEYRIRFQNTGTDTAFTIVVRDTLSDFLDIASLKIGASSHRFNWTIDGKNVLVFRFENILLPDSFRNEAASHGFVKFKISQKKDVALGTKINNQADIYFDFNAPIRTNKTVHTIGKDFIITALQTVSSLPNVEIKVYPNPFNAEATIEIQGFDPLSKTSNFQLFDALGRQIRSEKFEGNQFLFERQELPTGIYFFKIENGGRLVGTGKFLVK